MFLLGGGAQMAKPALLLTTWLGVNSSVAR